MSIECLNDAFNLDIRPASTKLVLLAMANYANEDGESYPSNTTLQKRTSLNKNTIKKALNHLRDLGILTDTGQRVGRTNGVIVYKINLQAGLKTGHYNWPDNRPPTSEAGLKTNTSWPKNGPTKLAQKQATEPSVFNHQNKPKKEKVKKEKWNIPAHVNQSAWEDFEAHRREIRKPLTNRARTAAAKKLTGLTHDEQRDAIDNTVQSRWTGIFPQNQKGNGNGKDHLSKSGRRNQNLTDGYKQAMRDTDPAALAIEEAEYAEYLDRGNTR